MPLALSHPTGKMKVLIAAIVVACTLEHKESASSEVSQVEILELQRLCSDRHRNDYARTNSCTSEALRNLLEDRQRNNLTNKHTSNNNYNNSLNDNIQKNYPTKKNGWEKNIFSSTGSPCIEIKFLDRDLVTSSKENCPARSELGQCRDIKYQAEFTNSCDSPIKLRWIFESKFSTWSQSTIQPFKSRRVSCLQSLDKCNGRIQWMVSE